MIIVEGPDGGGKTTLIRTLLDEVPGLELQPKFVDSDAQGGRDELMNRVAESITGPAKGYPKHLLYDRHPMVSEFIYSPCMGRPLAPSFAHPVARAWRNGVLNNSLTIVCLPPLDKVLETVCRTGNDQPQEVRWNISGIYEAYHAFVVLTPNPWQTYIYDYTDPEARQNVIETVKEYIG